MATEVTERILLRVPEAAEALGLSRAFVYELMAEGSLPVVRFGRAVRIPAQALRAWATAHAEPWAGGDA